MIPEYLISFDTRNLHKEKVDFLIIGGGIGGLRAAYELKDANTVLLYKDGIENTCSYNAQGGIAVAISENDSPEKHKADTIKAGCFLNNEEAVDILVNEGIERVKELIDMGFEFDRKDGKLHFTREGGHSENRILHSNGDSIGKSLVKFLYKKIQKEGKIKILHDCFLIDLICIDDKISAAIVLDERKNKIFLIYAKAYILSTGGAGVIFQETTNPSYITGDGIAITYRKNVKLADLEFYQFHPTTLYIAGAPRFLISESVRGEGGVLRNVYGDRFMIDYHPSAELAPRDIVTRAIIDQMKKTNSNCVYLDLTHLKSDYVKKRFPWIYSFCKNYGIDITKNLIPVRPAAHYFMGGIKTDLWGRTNISNLFACGECACTGVHGANRLASNSLLEGLVFGGRVGKKIKEENFKISEFDIKYNFPKKADILIDKEDLKRSIRSLMWRYVGIERDGEMLKYSLDKLQEWQKYAFWKEFYDRNGFESLNMLIVASLITQAALIRTETRGTHYRKDYPEQDDINWKKHIIISKKGVEIE